MSYDPAVGRWMETDPEVYVDGPNYYQAFLDSPMFYLDPSGDQAATTRPKLGPSAGVSYVVQLLQEAEDKFRNCWLYRAAGLDKMFAALTNAANQSKATTMAPNPKTLGLFQNGTYTISTSGWPPLTAVHESVHAFNYWNNFHQGWGDDAIKADEGMAWAVEQMLKAAGPLCSNLGKCTSCAEAQQLWDSVFNFLDNVEGSPAGTNAVPDTINRTHIWDVNAKLGLHFSASQLKPLFEAALKAKGVTCTITNPPARPKDKAGQPDPFA